VESLIRDVPDDWVEALLGEVCNIHAGPSGSTLRNGMGVSSGVPMITPKDIKGNRLVAGGVAMVEPVTASKLSRYRVIEGDIVCARTGELPRHALIEREHEGWLFGTGCLRLRPHPTIIPPYLNYYLGHPAVREWIQHNATGSAIPSLSAKTLQALPVVIPPAAMQSMIAAVLQALDTKIAIHDQISRTTAALRDSLLPLLVSGSIPLPDTAIRREALQP
jgi:restriction endonuclease S subunit